MPIVGSRRVVTALVLLVSLALVPSFAVAKPLGLAPEAGSTVDLPDLLAQLWGSLTGLWLAATDSPPPGGESTDTTPGTGDSTKNVIDPNGVGGSGGDIQNP